MRLFIFLLLIHLTADVLAQRTAVALDATWRMRQWDEGKKRGGEWIPAVVPGCVHSDLIRASRIDHPFYGTDEVDCKWIEQKDWVYETLPFAVPSDVIYKRMVTLRFNGLDTYASVQLNGTEILAANNAHRSWEVDVRSLLNPDGNVLRIVFSSPIRRATEALNALPYPIPGDSVRAVVRKPQFHFGWDWGPRLVTCGISRSIEWIAYDISRLKDCYFRQLEVNDTKAELICRAEVQSVSDTNLMLRIKGANFSGEWYQKISAVAGGTIEAVVPISIENPQLWWCNGQGSPSLCAFEIELLLNDQVLESRRQLIGLRDIRLITEEDSIGETFYFRLNGQPVYIKGANYIPLRYFPGEAKEEDYRRLIEQCKQAHINMLRVWGGGIYEDELFYDLCDQNGIMVWQDFMFACSMYPGDSEFLENVRLEATEQVRRLRNHPCLALWCGNNENAEGWERWGWKLGLSNEHIAVLQQAYDDVFKKMLPGVVSAHSNTDYQDSSPRFGRGDARSMIEGDSHYWGVWHDEEPFETLQQKIPRFMSEFGMQSYPSQEVLEEMLEDDELNMADEGIAQHQKHNRGFDLMERYMNNWYPQISRDEIALYSAMTQVVQAEAIAMGIEAQRRAMPLCMGTMYWQLNDVWPAFSWSGIDYKGTPKLLHRMLDIVYAPQLISCTLDGDELQIWWISDTRIDTDAMELDYAIYDGATFVGKPDNRLRSADEAIYQSPPLACKIGYGSSKLHTILLEDLGIDSPENLIVEARISYPGQPNPHIKRIQKLIVKSDMAIIPYHSRYRWFNSKTGKNEERDAVMFKRAY